MNGAGLAPHKKLRKVFGRPGKVCDSYNKISQWFDNARTKTLMEKEYLECMLKHLKPGAHLLDLGCGTGEPIARYFIKHGMKITGIDGAPKMIGFCRQRFPEMEWRIADMRTVHIDKTYDAVIAWDSFFHLTHQDQRQMFAIFKEHMADGGLLVFTTGKEEGEIYSMMDGEAFYHASLSLKEYRKLLAENGFFVLLHKVEDPDCGGHTVWVAEYRGNNSL